MTDHTLKASSGKAPEVAGKATRMRQLRASSKPPPQARFTQTGSLIKSAGLGQDLATTIGDGR